VTEKKRKMGKKNGRERERKKESRMKRRRKDAVGALIVQTKGNKR